MRYQESRKKSNMSQGRAANRCAFFEDESLQLKPNTKINTRKATMKE